MAATLSTATYSSQASTLASELRSGSKMDSPDITIEVNGMMCQKNCGSTVENAIKQVQGVKGAAASFASRSAFVWLHKSDNGGADSTTDKQLITQLVLEAVEDVGFEAILISNDSDTYSFLTEGRTKQSAAKVFSLSSYLSNPIYRY